MNFGTWIQMPATFVHICSSIKLVYLNAQFDLLIIIVCSFFIICSFSGLISTLYPSFLMLSMLSCYLNTYTTNWQNVWFGLVWFGCCWWVSVWLFNIFTLWELCFHLIGAICSILNIWNYCCYFCFVVLFYFICVYINLSNKILIIRTFDAFSCGN